MSADGKDDRGSRGQMAPEDRDAIKKRSDELGRRLDEARYGKDGRGKDGLEKSPSTAGGRGDAMGRALRVSAELIGGIVVGGAIGWFLDGWLGLQKPWFFVLFFLLGAAAGIMNVVRMAMRDRTPTNLPSVKDGPDDDRPGA